MSSINVESKTVLGAITKARKAVSGSLPATSHLSLVSSLANLRALQDDWRKLEMNSAKSPSVFQSFDWVMAWSDTYANAPDGPELHLLVGYDKGELVFVWPLMKTRRFGVATLVWLTDPFGQYGDILCQKDQCPNHWMSNATTFMKRLKGIDLLHLRHVRDDANMGTRAKELLRDARTPERAPWLDLSQFADEAAYDARYTGSQRKRRKKIRKHIEELGTVDFKLLPSGILADAAIDKAIAEKNQWLSERGRLNRVLGCPGHAKFLKNLSRQFGGTVEVIVSELSAGGKPVSWEIGFRSGKTHFGYITSHVNALTDLSPGRLHMDLSQRASLNDGMERFDLMVPYDAHKESWSSASESTKDYFLPFSSAGWMVGHGYLQTMRPIVRKLYYSALPAVFRILKIRSGANPGSKTDE
jgi:CelD/BcsL family acetyltransferase involved in cellulose biosynthesis